MSTSEELFQGILGFLIEEFRRSGGRQCVRLELQHAPTGYRPDVITSWDRSDDPALFELSENLEPIEGLAAQIVKRAEEEADSYGSGTHRFLLITHQQLGGRGRKSFSIAASFIGGDDDQLTLTDGANGSGSGGSGARRGGGGGGGTDLLPALSLQMRHNERLMNTNAQMFQGSLAVLADTNKSLRAELAEKDKVIAELTRMLNEAQDKKDERDLAALKQVASDQRKDRVIGKVLPLLPVVASRIVAGKDKDGKSSGDPQTGLQIVLGELAKNLQQTPGALQKISRSLNPTQMILFAEAMRMINEMTPAESEDKPAQPAAGTTGSPPSEQPKAG